MTEDKTARTTGDPKQQVSHTYYSCLVYQAFGSLLIMSTICEKLGITPQMSKECTLLSHL